MVDKHIGFDHAKYVKIQSAKIRERIDLFGDKLYLEFGGKLFDDLHASRILPGFRPDAKIEMLKELKDKLEIIFCINAGAIEDRKMRADHNISYEMDLLRQIDGLAKLGMNTCAVVITLFAGQPNAVKFRRKLEQKGLKVYCHTFTKGYPTDVDTIVSEKGYGAQPFIKTTKPLVVVTAPGPNSGKLATCLAQLYHENQRGVKAGYAKFETFPVWDLPLKHPVNLAYEAATADLGDVNMIDNFYLEHYGKTAVNYNRDVAVFPILKNILHRITGKDLYFSPTDMGVNTISQCIIDDEIVRRAAGDEIIRRYLMSLCEYKNGAADAAVPERIKLIMDELGLMVADRKVVGAALKTQSKKKSHVVAIELPSPSFSGLTRESSKKMDSPIESANDSAEIITGRDTKIMTASAAVVINALKNLAGIEDKIHLISPLNLDPLLQLKRDVYGESRLNLLDVLAALAVGAATNPMVETALAQLPQLKNLEAHSTVMLARSELDALKKLGLRVTMTDEFAG
jgi:uncharacterized protein (UPF0371 family)